MIDINSRFEPRNSFLLFLSRIVAFGNATRCTKTDPNGVRWIKCEGDVYVCLKRSSHYAIDILCTYQVLLQYFFWSITGATSLERRK